MSTKTNQRYLVVNSVRCYAYTKLPNQKLTIGNLYPSLKSFVSNQFHLLKAGINYLTTKYCTVNGFFRCERTELRG